MVKLKVQIQYVMLFEINNDKHSTESMKKLSNVYDQIVITDHQVLNWFSKVLFRRYIIKR